VLLRRLEYPHLGAGPTGIRGSVYGGGVHSLAGTPIPLTYGVIGCVLPPCLLDSIVSQSINRTFAHQIVAGFVSGAIVLAEFEHTTMPHFLAHCAAVAMVVIGVIGLVYGEEVRRDSVLSARFRAATRIAGIVRITLLSCIRRRRSPRGQQKLV
jgi:hypothetical protein